MRDASKMKAMSYERIKTEHAGAKNGGGAWMTRAEAKRVSERKRRQADKRTREYNEDSPNEYSSQLLQREPSDGQIRIRPRQRADKDHLPQHQSGRTHLRQRFAIGFVRVAT
jgi:hypothetical protein